tara:strand:+ start:128 stop:757 length:630 start_codon:yes stop_codon:yes gene_type:complete
MRFPIRSRTPRVHGWLESKLPEDAINHLWDCVKTARGDRWNSHLAGHIDSSFKIDDKDDWFWKNIIIPHIDEYGNAFDHEHARVSVKGQQLTSYLDILWVNYQNQHEFNPFHDHDGTYSFVVWMKIPTYHKEQNELYNAKDNDRSLNSVFQFQYNNTLGDIKTATYTMSPDMEGTMVFFPARMQHGVHPFYNCDDSRISIAGNVALKLL